MIQVLAPNPRIWCEPGWCLMYVRETFGIEPGLYPSATAGWNAARFKHQDRNFPEGCWVPIWFHLGEEPLGHVALMAPDGSVFSTSDLSNVPYHHPNLDHLLSYYRALRPTYLGWTEDIEGVRVVQETSLTPAGSTTEGDFTMAEADRVIEYVKDLAYEGWTDDKGKKHPGFMLVTEETQRRVDGITGLLMPGVYGERVAGVIPSMIADIQGTQKAILSALTNIGNGEPVDMEAFKAAAEEGARDALAQLNAVVTVQLQQEETE